MTTSNKILPGAAVNDPPEKFIPPGSQQECEKWIAAYRTRDGISAQILAAIERGEAVSPEVWDRLHKTERIMNGIENRVASRQAASASCPEERLRLERFAEDRARVAAAYRQVAKLIRGSRVPDRAQRTPERRSAGKARRHAAGTRRKATTSTSSRNDDGGPSDSDHGWEGLARLIVADLLVPAPSGGVR